MPEDIHLAADTRDETIRGKTAFVSVADTVLYDAESWDTVKETFERKLQEHLSNGEPKRRPRFSPKAANHLILGDWLVEFDKTETINNDVFVKVRCRGDDGWMRKGHFSNKRALEVNFVDIGQGDGCHIVTPDDDHMLIDAGKFDHMNRFLSWRYNLRGRNVEGTEDFDPGRRDPNDASQPLKQKPWKIDHIILSHPDEDHYGGFRDIFENKKLAFENVFHNGIIERPDGSTHNLGGYFKSGKLSYLSDIITTSTAAKTLIKKFPNPRTRLLQVLQALLENSPKVKITGIGADMKKLGKEIYLKDFEEDKSLSMRIVGPIFESVKKSGKTIKSLRKISSSKGVIKNGHSVVFTVRYNKLKLLLGGDLNSESQNFILQSYAGVDRDIEKIDKEIEKLNSKPRPLSTANQKKLDKAFDDHFATMKTGRDVFGVDVAKACHHGSAHILDAFVKCINASATVISSGDEESHSHPRPDALGTYGKLGHGDRPLIFSTELARSTREFTPKFSQYLALRGITLQIEAETDKKRKKALESTLQNKKDRNVAVYGMITLRALDDTVIVAQKLEKPRNAGSKWDIYELHFVPEEDRFVYSGH